jgi:phage shock protein PspC (stress-responsive transcriptional regulator)
MKKTINVNIGGMMFHLDEDAFEKLNTYLDALKSKFSKMEGGDEIIGDIEGRIAEIFKEKLAGLREVVSINDVDEMMRIMGDPSSFLDETTETISPGSDGQPIVKRRLFRDPEKRVIGGVCSGFAAYFNIDPWLVRVIMIALVAFGGVSGFLYFIFWIAMPKAVTTADRLMMKGKRVDVNSIEESVKKEWNETKSGLKNVGANARSSSFINGIGKFIRISFGVFLIFISTIKLALFFWCMLSPSATIHLDELHISVSEGANMIFDSFGEKLLAYMAAWLIIVVPCVMFIYIGIRLILQFKHKLRYVALSGFLLWIIGVVMGIYTIINIAEKYKMEASTRENPPIMISDSTTLMINTFKSDQIQGYNLHDLPIHNVDFDIVKTTTDSFPMLEITKFSQGKDKQVAFNLAQKINYAYKLDSNQLTLATYYMLEKGEKFRGQYVDIKLFLPIGYKVFLAKGTEDVLHDIANLQNVWDWNMPDHTWTMTKDGLSCDNCEEKIIRYRNHDDEDSLDHKTKMEIHVSDDEETHNITIN